MRSTWVTKKLEVSDQVPRLAIELLEKAETLGMTEEQLCRKLGVDLTFMSRWKRGQRPAPDPRDRKWKEFYVQAAKLLDRSLGEVVGQVLFFDPQEEKELDDWLLESIDATRRHLSALSLSRETQESIRQILMNLPGREEYVHVLQQNLRTYVIQVLKQRWSESSLNAAVHVREQQAWERRSDSYFGYAAATPGR